MAANDDVIINAQDVYFRYFESDNGVTDVNIQVRKGERIIVLGRNGSGKSTLLALFAGKRKAQKGTLTVLNRDAFDDTALNEEIALIGPPWPPEAFFASTVETVCRPIHNEERMRMIANALHLRKRADIDKLSAGEKRRVQILHGTKDCPKKVVLLDECNTEVDVAERRNVLNLMRQDCETNDSCVLYATHILDGVDDWATRVLLVEGGRITRDVSYQQLKAEAGGAGLSAYRWLAKKEFGGFPTPPPYAFDATATDDVKNAVVCENLSYQTRNKTKIFDNMNFTIPKGSRTLIVGCNGSGKTTLLHLLCGKTFFTNRQTTDSNSNSNKAALRIFGRSCYHDMGLNHKVNFAGDWWPKAPEGQMHVYQFFPEEIPQDVLELAKILRVNFQWDVRHVSAGELKRIQLLNAMATKKDMVILDEATGDLDLDMRHVLLQYLHDRSVNEGVTVIYTTHIFEGLENWATDCIILDRLTKGVHRHLRGPQEVEFETIFSTLTKLKSLEHFSYED